MQRSTSSPGSSVPSGFSFTSPARRKVLLGAIVFGLTASLGIATALPASAAGQPPIAVNDSFKVRQDSVLTMPWSEIAKNDSDPDGDSFEETSYTSPNHGSVAAVTQGGMVTAFQYTPDAGYFGLDSFTYQLEDSQGNLSGLATIFVTVEQNFAPKAVNDKYTAVSGQDLVVVPTNGILSNDTDQNHDPLFAPLSSWTPPAHGLLTTVQNSLGGFTYHPTLGYVGPDSFSYKAVDSTGLYSNQGTVTFDVKPAPPVVSKLTITRVPNGRANAKASLIAQIDSSNPFLAGAPVDVSIDGVKLAVGVTDSSGAALVAVPLPQKVGSFAVKASSGGVADTKLVTITAGYPAVSSITLAKPTAKQGRGSYLVSKIASSNPFRADAPVSLYIDGKKVATKPTDATGTVGFPVRMPALAGKHSIKVVSGSKSAVRNFSYGKGVTAKLSKLKSVKARKTETIRGSFGTKSGKVTLRITDPKGKTVTKTVKLNSKGKFSYSYKVGSLKGKYTVRYGYNPSTRYYGAKNYKLSFTVK